MNKKARYITGIIGFAVIAWGYSMHIYPWNVLLEILGCVVLLVAVFNPLSVFGKAKVTSGIYNDGKELKADGPDRRAEINADSTVQGGSNHGQGSSYLAGDAYKQGRDKSKGSNYESESPATNHD